MLLLSAGANPQIVGILIAVLLVTVIIGAFVPNKVLKWLLLAVLIVFVIVVVAYFLGYQPA